MRRTLKSVNYDALRAAAATAGEELPEALDATNDASLRRVHRALCDARRRRRRTAARRETRPRAARRDRAPRETRAKPPQVHVVEGCLVCPKSGRRFLINNGIPNMLLHEDEI